MYLCPESLILWDFRAFSVFRGLGGIGRHQPASYCGHHIVPYLMEFFNSTVDVLQTLVVALGAGLGVWSGINLLEGYGNDNPGANAHVR